ncbi:hypothetical protein [Streptomyces sp. NPDC057580]|uniref:hypothetical protein n=1 Tax=Streptomyces sp. NPDC057580 TaxID=3346173 RepID=UPI00367E0FE1
MRIRTVITAAALLVSLVGCGSGGDSADAKPSSRSSSSSPTPRAYDVHDCRALLERDYEAESLHDASGDPECKHLTHDEYLDVVKEVLTGRKDEILEDATNHVAWDEAWDGTDPKQQKVLCRRLAEDGAAVVGQEMADADENSSGDEVDMAQYILDEKC